ncbi:hypothetical protein C8R45DRAFT_1216610 [Mycena sanguinolenta]|nr:hypothetical protein C8R45DRAFT_1216610 [Mycena sanguinolenta]
MEPLKLCALPGVEDWDTFKPEMKGFISPQKMALWACCDTIQDQLGRFTSEEYMRDNDTPFIALSMSSTQFPVTRLTICEETFAVPVSPRDIAFLATHLGNSIGSRHTVPATEVSILSNTAKNSIWSTNRAVLDSLKALDGGDMHDTHLIGLDVFKAGSHCLRTAATDQDHYATIFLILPAFADSVDISVCATLDSVVSRVKLPEDLSQHACAVGVYTGVSNTHIEVGAGGQVICLTYHASFDPADEPCVIPTLQGALPPLRDGICLWRHRLNCGDGKTPKVMLFFLAGHPESAKDFKGHDATLLCHLAPLVKAYGFKMYIAEFDHVRSTREEVQHPYKEYFGWSCGAELDPAVLDMPDDANVEYEWKELRTLAGVPVVQQDLLNLATKRLKTNEYLREKVQDLEIEEDYDIEHDSCYFATVLYTHTRTALVLFITP